MMADMINTNQDPNKQVITPEPQQALNDDAEQGRWFHALSGAEKRFHILFYALACLTGILIVQVIWQVAVLTVGM